MEIKNLSISIMEISDLEEIKDNLEKEFDNFWNFNIFKSELENKNSTYFVLKNNSQIIGFAGVILIIDTADITNIVIKKDVRRNRIIKNIN